MIGVPKVYGLIDLRDEALCYIGLTTGRLEDRLYRHIHLDEKRWNFKQWISKHPVEIVLLDEGDFYAEKRLIVSYIKSNHMLFNIASLPEMTPTAREKFNKTQKTWASLRQEDDYPERLRGFAWEYKTCVRTLKG